MIEFKQEELILVTGASSGIGKATALLCNKLGARIIAVARSKEKLEIMKSEADFPENILIETRDLSEDLKSLVPWVTELRKKYGKFSGFVHSAGYSVTSPFKMFDLQASQKLFDLHYQAGVLIARGVTDRRNCEKTCSLVFMSSLCAVKDYAGLSMYAGIKGALLSAIRSMKKELAPKGVRVNSVAPGLVRTPLLNEHSSAMMGFDVLESDAYLLGIIEAQDVANSIAFLLSDASRMITGQNIVIDAGGN